MSSLLLLAGAKTKTKFKLAALFRIHCAAQLRRHHCTQMSAGWRFFRVSAGVRLVAAAKKKKKKKKMNDLQEMQSKLCKIKCVYITAVSQLFTLLMAWVNIRSQAVISPVNATIKRASLEPLLRTAAAPPSTNEMGKNTPVVARTKETFCASAGQRSSSAKGSHFFSLSSINML